MGSVKLAAVDEDLVTTGQTLRENGLVPVEEWLRVVPYSIVKRGALYFAGDEIRALRRTLGGPR